MSTEPTLRLLDRAFSEQFPELAQTVGHRNFSDRLAHFQVIPEDYDLIRRMYAAVLGRDGPSATPFSNAVYFHKGFLDMESLRAFLEGPVPLPATNLPPSSSPEESALVALRQGLEIYLQTEGKSADDPIQLVIFSEPHCQEYNSGTTPKTIFTQDRLAPLTRNRLAQGLLHYFSELEASPDLPRLAHRLPASQAILDSMNAFAGHRLHWDNRVSIFDELGVEDILDLNPALREAYSRGVSLYLCNDRATPTVRGGFLCGNWTLSTGDEGALFSIKFRLQKGQMMIENVRGNHAHQFAARFVERHEAKWAPSYLLATVRYLANPDRQAPREAGEVPPPFDDLEELYGRYPKFMADLVDEFFPGRSQPVYYLATSWASAFTQKNGRVMASFRLTTTKPVNTLYIGFRLDDDVAVITELWANQNHYFPVAMLRTGLMREDPKVALANMRSTDRARFSAELNPNLLFELAQVRHPDGGMTQLPEYYLVGSGSWTFKNTGRMAGGLERSLCMPKKRIPYAKIQILHGQAWIVELGGNHGHAFKHFLVETNLARLHPVIEFREIHSLTALNDFLRQPQKLFGLVELMFPDHTPQEIWLSWRNYVSPVSQEGHFVGNLQITLQSPLPGMIGLCLNISGSDPHLTGIKAGEQWTRTILTMLASIDRDQALESDPTVTQIELELELSKPPTEAEISEIIRAIVNQDGENYPGQDVSRMSTSPPCIRKWYRFGNQPKFCLLTLCGWLRQAKGFESQNTRDFGNVAVIRYWKMTLYGLGDEGMSERELLDWVAEQKLGEVVSCLLDTPNALEDFMRALFPKISDQELRHRFAGFRELQLSGAWAERFQDTDSGGQVPLGGDPLILALLRRREILETMSEESLARMASSIQHHFERSFNREPEKTLQAMATILSQVDDPRVQKLLRTVLDQFQYMHDLAVPALRTELKPFQNEGVLFLSGRLSALLADEPGMGKTIQAIAAVEYLREQNQLASPSGGQKVLIICPASVKRGWARHLSEDGSGGGHLLVARHSILIEGTQDERRETALTQARDADYVIVNYEYLVNASPEELEAVLAGVCLKIVDEAQMVQNPSDEIHRAAAVRSIKAHRTWYLTATPYYGRLEHIWTLLNDLQPDQHGTLASFKLAFAKDEIGWISLHRTLQDIMLRRRKELVIGTYDPDLPLADQPLLLPAQRWIPHSAEGAYTLSPEQQDLSLLLMTNFNSFWEIYGEPDKNADEISALQKLDLLFKISHQPDLFGCNGIEPKWGALDEIVARRISLGQKLVIYTNRRQEVQALARRYAEHKSVLFMGGLTEREKEKRRQEFQDGDASLIIGTEAMMLGIDLTAADAVIFAQQPNIYTKMYQMAERAQRLDPAHRRYSYDIIRMVGVYPGLDNPSPEEQLLLEKGSYDEILSGQLESHRRAFHMVMDLAHVCDMAALDEQIKTRLSRDLFPEVSGHQRKKINAGEIFYPLYVAARSFDPARQAQAQRAVIDLATLYTGQDEAAGDLVRLYLAVASDQMPVREMELLGQLEQLRHKQLRHYLLGIVPELLLRLHGRGQNLAECLEPVETPRALHVLAWFVVSENESGTAVRALWQLIDGLDQLPEDETRDAVLAQLSLSLLRLVKLRENFSRFMERHATLFNQSQETLTSVAILTELADLTQAMPELFDLILEENFGSLERLQQTLQAFRLEPYLVFFPLPKELHPTLAEFLAASAPLGGFLDLAQAYQNAGMERELDLLRGMFLQIIRGGFAHDRRADTLQAVPYASELGNFWAAFNEGLTSVWVTEQSFSQHSAELIGQVQELLEALTERATDALVDPLGMEHPFVWQKVGIYLRQRTQDLQDKLVGLYQQAHNLIGDLLHGSLLADEDQELIRRVLGSSADLRDPAWLARAHAHLARLLPWCHALQKIREGIRTWERSVLHGALGELSVLNKRHQALAAKARDPILTRLHELTALLKHHVGHAYQKPVIVEDVDDWEKLLHVGALAPEYVNCLAPTGDVRYTKALVDLLGSRNKRIILVRDQAHPEKILSIAMLKVRRDEQGNPVWHVERPFGVKGHKFLDEILGHVEIKRGRADHAAQITLTRYVRSKSEDKKAIEVRSTGSVGRWEHVEDIFDVWQEATVVHRAFPIKPTHLTKKPIEMREQPVINPTGATTTSASLSAPKQIASLPPRALKAQPRAVAFRPIFPHVRNPMRVSPTLHRILKIVGKR